MPMLIPEHRHSVDIRIYTFEWSLYAWEIILKMAESYILLRTYSQYHWSKYLGDNSQVILIDLTETNGGAGESHCVLNYYNRASNIKTTSRCCSDGYERASLKLQQSLLAQLVGHSTAGGNRDKWLRWKVRTFPRDLGLLFTSDSCVRGNKRR